jgi:hypothetical protein
VSDTDIPLRLGPRADAAYQPPERPAFAPATPTGPSTVVAEAFVIGLVVGGPRDPSALVVVERTAEKVGDEIRHELRYLERWGAGTPFTTVARRVRAITDWGVLERRELYKQRLGLAMVVCDNEGLGRLAVQLLTRLDPRLPALAVEIGSERMKQSDEGWRVPEADLVQNFRNLQRAGRIELGFPEDLEYGAELDAQVRALKVEAAPSGRDRYAPEAGLGDDLLRALLLNCWWGEVASPGRIGQLPDPHFHAWSPEALRIQEEEGRRIKPYLPDKDKFMIEGV